MRSLSSVLACGSLLIGLASPALCGQWTTVYQNDFSTDPGWKTNDPANMYWDSANGRYHVKSWDTSNTYAYVSVPIQPGRVYIVEYDVCVVRMDWAGDVRFGLGDGVMNVTKPTEWTVGYWRGDLGNGIMLVPLQSNP